MTSIVSHGTKVYPLSAAKSLPEFLEEAVKLKQSLKKNEDFKQRIEVLYGFEFSSMSGRVSVSADGRYIAAVGMYAPELKIYDTHELSVKCVRGTDSEIVDFLFLTDDYSKMVLLEADRNLEFHDAGGKHAKVRIPKFGRQLSYLSPYAELVIAASGPEIYRMDLHEGVFKDPYLSTMSELNSVKCDPTQNVTYAGGAGPGTGSSAGYVEVWDPRISERPANVVRVTQEDEVDWADIVPEVTAIDYDSASHTLAAGTSYGIVKLYDTRYLVDPIARKDHNVDSKITDLKYITLKTEIGDERAIASCDSSTVRIWRSHSNGAIEDLAAYDGQGRLNSVCHYPRSGLFFIGQDYKRVGVHFIPSLGIAPAWSPFLDSVIDEMDNDDSAALGESSALFNDYLFLTRAELHQLKQLNKVEEGREGEPDDLMQHVRPHQHGFLIRRAEYRKFKTLRNTKHLELMKQLQTRRELKDGPMRIKIKSTGKRRAEESAPKSNFKSQLAELARAKNEKGHKAAEALLQDPRMAELLEMDD